MRKRLILFIIFCGLFWHASHVQASPTCSQTVANAAQLNAAIACFNGATDGDHTITLTDDIAFGSTPTAINNTTQARLWIDGQALYALNGGTAFRPITLTAGELTLHDLTITKGFHATEGGGIAVANAGVLTLIGSTVNSSTSDKGGGIHNRGVVQIIESTISKNSAEGSSTTSFGGGIHNSGTLTLTRSLIQENTSQYIGGGAFNSGTLTSVNSTFSGNSANVRGGALYNTEDLYLDMTTLAENSASTSGGSIFLTNGSLLRVTHSLIADGSCYKTNGSIVSIEQTLLEPTGADACNMVHGQDGNLVGVDPLLANLANNGGATLTHALAAGSPAINAAGSDCGMTDQRFNLRVNVCDMGAYERGTSVRCAATADDGASVFFSADSLAVQKAIDAAFVSATVKIAGRCTGANETDVNGDTLKLTAYINKKRLTLEGGHTINDWKAGPDQRLYPTVLDAQQAGGVVLVDGSQGAVDVTLSHLMIQNGDAPEGGGVRTMGDVSLTVAHTHVWRNSADDGAGLFITNDSVVMLQNSTVAYNHAIKTGGGIANSGDLLVALSTLSHNAAGEDGGGLFNAGTLAVQHSTISHNGAGNGDALHNSGSTLITSAIIGNSTNGKDCTTTNSSVTATKSLFESPVSHACHIDQSDNILGTDPQLGPLADYGGQTDTHRLQGGSPAIGNGLDCPTTDQRGYHFDSCDIGAFAHNGIPPYAICDLVIPVASFAELDAAIRCINYQESGNYTISLTSDLLATAHLTSIDLQAGVTLRVLGNGRLLDGGGAFRPITIEAGIVIIDNIHISNGYAAEYQYTNGGAILNKGTLTLTNSTLSNNYAQNSGGAIDQSLNSSLVVLNSTFDGNSAGYSGGAINNNGDLSIASSTFTDNSTQFGGAIYNYLLGETTIATTTFDDNTGSTGGAIHNFGDFTLESSLLIRNSASQNGGAIYNLSLGEMTLTNSTLTANSSTTSGGAVYNAGTITLLHATVFNNSSSNGGGLDNNDDGVIHINNSIVAGNTAVFIGDDCRQGGAVVSADYSLMQSTTNDGCNLVNGANGNIVGQSPQLGTLADNGGATQTIAPQAGSPVINTANATTCAATDQRGYGRDSVCDMGAFETAGSLPTAITLREAEVQSFSGDLLRLCLTLLVVLTFIDGFFRKSRGT